jgi:hypothetical protein
MHACSAELDANLASCVNMGDSALSKNLDPKFSEKMRDKTHSSIYNFEFHQQLGKTSVGGFPFRRMTTTDNS